MTSWFLLSLLHCHPSLYLSVPVGHTSSSNHIAARPDYFLLLRILPHSLFLLCRENFVIFILCVCEVIDPALSECQKGSLVAGSPCVFW